MAVSRVVSVGLLVAAVVAVPHDHSTHSHSEARSLPGNWWQERSQVHELFVRAPAAAAIGSQAWLAQYPDEWGVPSQKESDIPPAWLAAYKAAKAAGKIPDIPVSQVAGFDIPNYGKLDPMGPEVCSSTPKCMTGEGDIWNAPEGVIGISFDDGPWEGTAKLLDFLEEQKQPATHYCIGRNIAQRPQEFIRAFNLGGEMAVHTWSHPQMTNQTDLGVLVELGWTMQIIHDLTGGRVPKYWRPPTGDNDNRVRAIAREVFGLSAVMWNQDTEDWSLTTPTPVYSGAKVQQLLTSWLSGPKTTGLIILEHELSNDTVGIFMNTTWAGVKQYGWKPMAIAELLGTSPYQNAKDNTGAVTPVDGIQLVAPAAAGGAAVANGTTSSSAGSSPATAIANSTDSSIGPSETDASAAGRVVVGMTALLATFLAALII